MPASRRGRACRIAFFAFVVCVAGAVACGQTLQPVVTDTTMQPILGGIPAANLVGQPNSTDLNEAGDFIYSPSSTAVYYRAGAGATATAVATVAGGLVTNITRTSGGSRYISAPAVALIGGGGSGATASATFDSQSGLVTGVTLLNAGNGYTTAPKVVFTGGHAAPGAPTRIIQYGDAVPGIANSVVDFVGSVRLNASGQAVLNLSFTDATGQSRNGTFRWDGINLTQVALSNQPAPNTSTNYGAQTVVGFDDSGDVAFTSLTPNVGTPGSQTVLFFAPPTGFVVHVAGFGDPATGLSGTFNAFTAATMNNAGKMAFYASTSGGASAIYTATVSGGVATINKVAASTDAQPAPFSGTFGTISSSFRLNNAGDVAFSASVALWLLHSGQIFRIAALSDPAPVTAVTPNGTTLQGPVLQALNDQGIVAFTSTTTSATSTRAMLFESTAIANDNPFLLAAWAGGDLPLPNTATPTTQFSAVSINNSGLISFRYTPGAGANGVYQSTPSATLSSGIISRIAFDGDTASIAGGGTLLISSLSSSKTLDSGQTSFNALVLGGTADSAWLVGDAGGLSRLMTTGDALIATNSVSLRTAGVRTAGNYVGFIASLAGGRPSYFVYDTSKGFNVAAGVMRIVTRGDAAPGVSRGQIVGLLDNEVFVNPSGQVILSATFETTPSTAIPDGLGAGIYSWTAGGGLQRVINAGDTDAANNVYTLVANTISQYDTLPMNAAGQVVFHATLGSNAGTFVVSTSAGPNALPVKVYQGNDVSPIAGKTFANPSNTNFVNDVINDAGMVFFSATINGTSPVSGSTYTGVFAAVPGQAPVKIAAVGDAGPGTTQFSAFSSVLSVNRNSSASPGNNYVLFLAALTDGRFGLFKAAPGVPPTPVFLTGDATPIGGTYDLPSFPGGTLFASTLPTAPLDATINDDGNIVFRANITGSFSAAAIFVYDFGTQSTFPLAISGQMAPGATSPFASLWVGSSFRPAEGLVLTNSNEVYFAANLADANFSYGVWRSNIFGVPSLLFLRGTNAPTGGQIAFGSSHFSIADNSRPSVWFQVAGGGTVADAIWQVLPGADISTSLGGAPVNVAKDLPQQVDFEISNSGPDTAENVTATASLNPSNGGTFANYPSYCSLNGSNTLVCSVGAVPPDGANGPFFFTYTLTPTVLGQASLTHTVSSTTPDPDTSNNSDTATTTVVNGADIFVTSSSSATSVLPGASVTYNFTAGNNGPDPVGNVTAYFLPSGGFTVTSINGPSCTLSPLPFCTLAGGVGTSSPISVTGTAGSQIGTFYMTAVVDDGSYADTNPANNFAAIPLTVTASGATESYLVTDRDLDLLHVYDAATNTELLPAVTTGLRPVAIAISPNGRTAYIVSRNTHYVSVVDLTTHNEIERWPYYGSPVANFASAAVTADGSKLVVMNHDAVRVFSTATGTLLASPNVNAPRSMTLSGNIAYFNSNSSTVPFAAVDLTTYGVTPMAASNLPQGTNLGNAPGSNAESKSIAVTPDGQYLIASHGGSTAIFNLGDGPGPNHNLNLVPVPDRSTPWNIRITRDGNDPNGVYAYVLTHSTSGAATVNVLDVMVNSITFQQYLGSLALPFTPASAELSADSTRLFVVGNDANGLGQVAIIDTRLLLTTPASAILYQHAVSTQNVAGVADAFIERAAPAPPAILTVQPSTITAGSAQTISIFGTNFSADAVVTIGHGRTLTTSSITPTLIQATVPALPPAGTFDVTVINRNTASGVQQQNQAAVATNALIIQQAPSFQPSYQAVTTNLDEYNSFGSGVFSSAYLGQNFYIPTAVAVSLDGARAYTASVVNGIAAVNLTTKSLEQVIPFPGGNISAGEILAAKDTNTSNAAMYLATQIPNGSLYDLQVQVIDTQNGSSTLNQVIHTYNLGLQLDASENAFAVTSDGNYGYIETVDNTNCSLNLVPYNFSALAVGTTIPLPNAINPCSNTGPVSNIGITPDNNYLLIPNRDGLSLDVWSIAGANRLAPAFVTNIAPVGIAELDSFQVVGTRLFLSDFYTGTLQIRNFDPATLNFAQIGLVTLPQLASYYINSFGAPVTVSPDGNFLYVALLDSDEVQVFSAAAVAASNSAGALVARIGTTKGPFAIGVAPAAAIIDVSLSLTSPSIALNGSNVTFTATATNHGPLSASGVTVTDTLPTGMTLVSAPGCSGTTTLVCNVGSLAVGTSAVFDVTVNVASAINTTLTNTASVVANETDSNLANNTASASTTVVGGADLAITGTVDNATPIVGSGVGFTLTVSNSGPDTVNSAVVSVVPPAGFSGGTLSVTSTASTGYSCNQATLQCTLPNFVAGTATIMLGGTVNQAGALQLNATVGGAAVETNPANNSTSVGINVSNPASSDVSLSVSPANATTIPGGTVTFNITVHNAGPDPANFITLTATLPPQLTFSGFTQGVPCTPSGSTVSCTLNYLDINDTATYQLTAAVSGVGSFTTTFAVTPDTTETAPANNTAAATVNSTQADLAVSVNPTCDLTCVATVVNNGPSPASNVVLSDTLNRYTLTNVQASNGTCTTTSTGLSCSLGSLALNGSAQVTVTVTPPASGWASHQFHATATEPDPNPMNNAVNRGPGGVVPNTEAGVGVTVAAGTGFTAIVNFDSVTQPGMTAATSSVFSGVAPAGFRLGNPTLIYDVTTSATYSGTIRVTLPFSPAMFHHPAKVRIFHLEGGVWVDRTVAVNAAGTATASTTSLSPFLLVEPLNNIPVAVATDVAASASAAKTQVTLNGTGSHDGDGDALTYRWAGPFPEGGGVVTGATPAVTLPPGASKISLVVSDGESDSAAATFDATVADFQLNSGNTAITVQRGDTATLNLNVTSLYGAFANPVALSCTNLPAGYACRFSPAQVVPGGNGASVVVSIAPAQSSRHRQAPLWPLGFTAAGLVLSGVSLRWRRWLLLLLALALCAAMIACGGGGMTSHGGTTTTQPQSTTSVITLSGVSGSVAHSATVTMTLQP